MSRIQNEAIEKVLDKIRAERQRQIVKWGPQNHNAYMWFGILIEEVEEVKRAFNADPIKENVQKLKTELEQTAAVCAAWLEDIENWEKAGLAERHMITVKHLRKE